LACHGHDCRRTRAGGGGAHDLTNAFDLTNWLMVCNLSHFVLFLHNFMDLRRRRIGHLHRATADKRAATSASTKFR
jgi:hypothetical protein